MTTRTTMLVAGAALALSACTSTLKAPQLGANGRFTTGATVNPEKITINGPFVAAEHRRMAVVLNFTEDARIKDFFYQSISNSGVFQRTFNEVGLERYVLENNIRDVTDTSSLISLRNLARAEGNFLIIKPYIEAGAGYQVKSWLEVTDAASGQLLFRTEKQATNWAGLDSPLFYPLFNSLIDWTEGKAVAVTPAAPPATPARN